MLTRDNTVLVVIDYQERMMPVIHRGKEVIAEAVKLIQGCVELRIPMLLTEQYPRGLGHTVTEIRDAMDGLYEPLEKTVFSSCGAAGFMKKLQGLGRQNTILCGVESHVCVYQTVRDLRGAGYDVYVTADTVSSRTEANLKVALQRYPQLGAQLTSVEMALFELMARSDIPEFKTISRLVK